MSRKNRILLGVLLTLVFAISFFMLGAFTVGKLGLAEGQGLAGEQALKMLTALRGVEPLVLLGGFSCAVTPGEELLRFEIFIPEA